MTLGARKVAISQEPMNDQEFVRQGDFKLPGVNRVAKSASSFQRDTSSQEDIEGPGRREARRAPSNQEGVGWSGRR